MAPLTIARDAPLIVLQRERLFREVIGISARPGKPFRARTHEGHVIDRAAHEGAGSRVRRRARFAGLGQAA